LYDEFVVPSAVIGGTRGKVFGHWYGFCNVIDKGNPSCVCDTLFFPFLLHFSQWVAVWATPPNAFGTTTAFILLDLIPRTPFPRAFWQTNKAGTISMPTKVNRTVRAR
jgi:hypothetical protein